MNKKSNAYQDVFGAKIDDLDAMRQAIEELAGASFAREYGDFPIFTSEEVRQARKAAQAQIEKLQKDLKRYDETIEFIESLPFKEGDAAFHKDHGNVLIHGVSVNKNFQNSTYSIVLKTGKRLQVKTDELMPISEATKVLFGKK